MEIYFVQLKTTINYMDLWRGVGTCEFCWRANITGVPLCGFGGTFVLDVWIELVGEILGFWGEPGFSRGPFIVGGLTSGSNCNLC